MVEVDYRQRLQQAILESDVVKILISLTVGVEE